MWLCYDVWFDVGIENINKCNCHDAILFQWLACLIGRVLLPRFRQFKPQKNGETKVFPHMNHGMNVRATYINTTYSYNYDSQIALNKSPKKSEAS